MESMEAQVDGEDVDVELAPMMVDLFTGESRYRVARGGRGSAKTRGFAKMAAVRAFMWGMAGIQGQILCAREHLNSLEESSMTEIKMAIAEEPWLAAYFDVGEKYIRSHDRNVEFVFAGLRKNLNSIKSKARLLLCWVDEAETVPESAWMILIPTVREDNSEIWVSYNPESKLSATDKRFYQTPSDDMKIVTMNYRDNPWFPQVLENERLNDKKLRPDTYDHVWEGDYLEFTEGSYYINEMRDCKDDGRMERVPYNPALAVVTAWDLGVGDSTAIWFAQFVGLEVHIIDCYECNGVGLDHYAKMLQDKKYVYDQHILPFDVEVRELGTGKSRLEVLGKLGLTNIVICPKIGVDDGIQSVRSFLSQCWIDAENCADGISAMKQYRREYNETTQQWHNRPRHDWTSHYADAFRYLSVGRRVKKGWDKPIKRNLKGLA
jgi:phage terminase large subunit